mgnify:CR=1 FL=1
MNKLKLYANAFKLSKLYKEPVKIIHKNKNKNTDINDPNFSKKFWEQFKNNS